MNFHSMLQKVRRAVDPTAAMRREVDRLTTALAERDAALAAAVRKAAALEHLPSEREAALSAELRAMRLALAEFDDPDPSPRYPEDPLVSPQSVRTKMIDGFVEGWGPAAHRVTPQLRARFPDLDDEGFWEIAHRALPHTALSVQRLYAVYAAVKYIVAAGVGGDVVECGVFKGGAAIMIAQSLAHFGDTSRRIFLFDTFEGWPVPTDQDTDFLGQQHRKLYQEDLERSREASATAPPSVYRLADFFDRTRDAILGNTQYPHDRIHFVRGLVEQTLPHADMTDDLALLRLDTDYYESTAWEMKVLWPRLVTHGVLMLDDYGQFHGARRAIDEYLAANAIRGLLHRDDVTGRCMVKLT
jgi:hypothetical protein